MASHRQFPIISVEPGWFVADEQMGSKAKQWICWPERDERWLFKFARVSAGEVTGEHWAEKLAAEIAALIGVPHAEVELASLDGRMGSLSRRFTALSGPGQVDLVHGNVLLAASLAGYDSTKLRQQSEHTLDNIMNVIANLFADEVGREEAKRAFAGYMVLDALILNTDRHHENWAVFRSTHTEGLTTHAMAPSFDHASSLARNEPPMKLSEWLKEDWRPQWYAARARGGIYLSDREPSGANPLDLLEVAVRSMPSHFEPWLQSVGQIELSALEELLDRVPKEVMSPAARSFVKALLATTLFRLKSIKI